MKPILTDIQMVQLLQFTSYGLYWLSKIVKQCNHLWSQYKKIAAKVNVSRVHAYTCRCMIVGLSNCVHLCTLCVCI